MNESRSYSGRWRRRMWLAWLPKRGRQTLRRVYYGWQIRSGRFGSDEAEFAVLDRLVRRGDWVLDVGANLGRYTVRMSALVGSNGRVFAFEPLDETFEILATNVRRAAHPNVTLVNAAVSDKPRMACMAVPHRQTGLAAHYFAHLADGPEQPSGPDVFCCTIDSLGLPERVSLAKIDVEGHEAAVLEGMSELLRRDRPTLIIETDSPEVIAMLGPLGYIDHRLDGSHNHLLTTDRGFSL